MSIRKNLALTLLLLAATSVAQANPVAQITQALTAVGNKPLAVVPSPAKGIYLAVLPQGPVYVDAAAQHVIQGQIFNLKTQEPLTQKQIDSVTPKFKWQDLPLQDAVKVVKGNGKRKVAVFSDPDCPYCKMLEEKSIAKLTNVTVYTFLYPISQIHPDAARKSAAIWCSPVKDKAWTNWMLKGSLPNGKVDCATPLARNDQLARKLWVFGTPAIFFPSGERANGALMPEDLDKRLGK